MSRNRFFTLVLLFTLALSLSPSQWAKASPAKATTWPIYHELALDDSRGWIYGSDSAGNKVDVISTTTLELVKSFTLVNGARPKGLALSPDNSELAIAQNGAGSILFINPDNGEAIATVVPTVLGANTPWDVIYGRAGRLYSSGTANSDYIHIIDTVTHSELNTGGYPIGPDPRLAISSDNTRLFANASHQSPQKLYMLNVSTDTIPSPPLSTPHTSGFTASNYVLLADDTRIMTNTGQVWLANLSAQIGSFTPLGYLVKISSKDLVAVISYNTPGLVSFVKTSDYYTASTYMLLDAGTNGPGVVTSDDSKLYINTRNGMKVLDLNSLLTLNSGSPQSMNVQKPFTTPLQVAVKDAHGNPVTEMEFTFTAPESGPSGIFSDSNTYTTTAITDSNGIATAPAFTANSIGGNYVVKAIAPGLASFVEFNLTNLPDIQISGNAGIADLIINYNDGGPRTVTTDSDGNYVITVPYNWSGTVTTSKPGVIFTPTNHSYGNLTTDQTGQNFTATVAISGNVGAASIVMSYENNGLKYITSNSNGAYTITVPYNWSGTVMPISQNYIFTPTSTSYTELKESQTNQNYVAEIILHTISGNTGVGGVTLSYFDGTSKTILSDINGQYTLTVPYNWSGTVTPFKTGYRFTPASKSYSNVTANKTDENYTETVLYQISGNTGIGNANIGYSYTSNGSTFSETYLSDAGGNYSFWVPAGLLITVSPYKNGFSFAPIERTYNINTNQPSQNYTASPILYTISGNAGTGEAVLSYYDGSAKTAIADANGNYSFQVSYNWNGSVTPSKSSYIFIPTEKTYSAVKNDQENQNFTAFQGYYVSGSVNFLGTTLQYEVDGTPKSVTVDQNGAYTIALPMGWSGTITPYKAGYYTFTPESRAYTNLQSNQTAQNYTSPGLRTISGTMEVPGATLSYDINGITQSITANSSGVYSLLVPYGWTGTITPSKPNVIFTPATRAYTQIQTNQYNENYESTLIVSSPADSGVNSLRQAISDSLPGATIQFDPTLTGQTIALASSLTITKNLTIDGAGLESRIEISGENTVRPFMLDYTSNGLFTVTLRNIVIKNGKQTSTSYTGYGGAIYIDGSTELIAENVLIKNCSAYTAGAVYISGHGKANFINSEILNNTASQQAGAIYINSIGILNLKNSKLIGNTASSGGALSFSGATNTSHLEYNVFENNSALAGGAINAQLGNANIEIRGNLFKENHSTGAYNSGGAMRISASSIPTIVIIENNTFYENDALGYGGGAYLEAAVSYTFNNNTFSENKGSRGGNLYLAAGASMTQMFNNIMANHAGGGDCYAFYNAFINGSNNLIEDGSTSCSPTLTGDPMLGTLADNGGFPQTLALLPNSPAINAGSSLVCPVKDQRGIARPQGSVCDLGAYELIDTTAPETTINSQSPATTPNNSTSMVLTFSGSDGESGVKDFQCSLDGETFTTCSSPITYNNLGEGQHTFSVRAKDILLNTDESPAIYTWTVDTTAPDTKIDSTTPSTSLTNSATLDVNFSSPDATATFECSLDDTAFATCASPQNLTNLSDGPHTFSVRAIDLAGNLDSSPASYTWTVDTLAPETQIDSQPANPSGSAEAVFTFSSPDAAATFECSLNEEAFATCSSPATYGNLEEGAHTFTVHAKDALGNTDPTPASHTWAVDTTTPDTQIDSTSLSTSPTNSTTLDVNFSSPDATATFECSLDDMAFAACSSPQNLTSLGEGQHTFTVRAKDAAGNTDSTPASYTWTVDTTPPDTQIDSVSPSTSLTNSTTLTIAFSSVDNTAGFECKLDNDAFTACTSPQNLSSLTEGQHTFSVRAIDTLGNIDATPASYTWTVDLTAPDTFITAKPANPTLLQTANFGFTSNDLLATFECSLDGAAFVACASPVAYNSLSFARHTFSVRAVDAAGNPDPSPATFTWVVWRERVFNGGFNLYPNTTTKIPTRWAATNFGPLDGKSATNRKEGAASIHLGGAVGTTKTLQQSINLSGLAGSPISFSFWVKGTNIPTSGLCRGQVLLYNGASLVAGRTINCPTGTFGYTQKKINFTAPAGFTNIIVKFTYAKPSGDLWLDLVSLFK